MSKVNRATQKAYFGPKAIPTASHFADLIDSILSQDDGIAKSENSALCVAASPDMNKGVIKLYESVDDLTQGEKFRNLVDCRINDYLDKDEFLVRLRAGATIRGICSNKDGKPDASLKIIAGMLGVGLDELKQREAARRRPAAAHVDVVDA